MPVIAAIGDPRAGGAGAKFPHRLGTFGDNVRIVGQPKIVVGAQQQLAVAFDHRLGGREHMVQHHAERIGFGPLSLGDLRRNGTKLVE